jgi:hypothetical protein
MTNGVIQISANEIYFGISGWGLKPVRIISEFNLFLLISNLISSNSANNKNSFFQLF